MKRFDIYIAVVAALFVAAACTKERPAEQYTTSPRITLSDPDIIGTRSILHSTDFTGDTSMEVYDYRTILNAAGEPVPELSFSDVASYTASTKDWGWGSEPDGGYPWFNGKTPVDHSFFSWLLSDKDNLKASALFGDSGLSFNENTKVLTVPAVPMTLTTTQFDFCYSTIVERKKERADYSPVSMPLHHLFTSFGVKAYNYTSDKITLTSVKLYGLVNNKGAQIAYDLAEGKTSVTYGASDRTGSTKLSAVELVKNAAPIEMAANSGVNNIITSEGLTTSADNPFYLMWPQTAADLNITTAPAVNSTTGTVTAGEDQAFIVIGYEVGSSTTPTYKAIPLRPASWVDEDGKNTVGWDAGTCHQIEISFTDTQLGLTVTVQPWDLYEPEIDYSGEIQVKSTGKLAFSGNGTTCTVDETARRVYFKGGNPITATFTIDAPLDATWMISKKGDYDAFEIDDTAQGSFGDNVDTVTGTIDGNAVTFTIYPKISDPDEDREINLAFSVRLSNGNVYSIDKLIQGDDSSKYYTIVLQAS